MPRFSRPCTWACPGLLLLCIAAPVAAADPKPDTSRGERLLDTYFRLQTQRLADACLADVRTKADWEKKRPELRRQFLDLKGAPRWLQGKGDMAGIVLYAAVFEPDVARLDLWYPPATHRHGPILLNVRRFLDIPQAVALAFPRQIRLYVKSEMEAGPWEWPLQLQKALGQEHLTVRPVGE